MSSIHKIRKQRVNIHVSFFKNLYESKGDNHSHRKTKDMIETYK